MASDRSIALETPPGSGPLTVAEVLADVERRVGSDAGRGVAATHFDVLDHVLGGGLRAGDLTLVGGPPGVGKTVATLQWARNMAMAGDDVLYICYEHDERSLFSRLLQLEVGSLPATAGAESGAELRDVVRMVSRSQHSMRDAVAGHARLRAAAAVVARYQHRLALCRGDRMLDVEGIAALVDRPDAPFVVFVDYLQKVPSARDGEVENRVADVAEALKEVALAGDVAVVAVVSSDRNGLTDRRIRLHHVRGSAALAYEADVVIMLNDKERIVSRIHTAYDALAFDRYRNQVVFTVEKNRDGAAGIDTEFTKDFAYYRFDPEGDSVDERLIDEWHYIS